jgi:hypothetical protein
MKLEKWTKRDCQMEQRIQLIVNLACRRDRILESPELDLAALTILASDYEAAGLPCAAVDLRSRLEACRARLL